MRYLWLMILSLAAVSSGAAAVPSAAPVRETAEQQTIDRDRFVKQVAELLQEAFGTVPRETAETLLRTQCPDGSRPGIDYRTCHRTEWSPSVHMQQVRTLCLVYADTHSPLSKDPTVRSAILRALRYWYEVYPVSNNWWQNQVLVQRIMGEVFVLCEYAGLTLPSDLYAGLLKRWASEGGNARRWTGANKLNIAAHTLVRGVLIGRPDIVRSSLEQLLIPLKVTNREGLQTDGSFHQHGNQLYIANYGFEWIKLYSFRLCALRGCAEVSPEAAERVSAYVRNLFMPAVLGHWPVYNARGRQQADMPRDGESVALILPILKRMERLDPSHAADFRRLEIRLTVPPDRADYAPMSAVFCRSDYLLHVRQAFTFDSRTASVRTCRCESGYGENLLGYWMAEGSSGYYRAGNEYVNIVPLWDWYKVPGTSVVDLRDPDAIPPAKA